MEKETNKYHTITVLGDSYKTLLTKNYTSRKKWEEMDESKFLSFIPGTVSQIFVSEGQAIEKDDKLMVLEAMKMNNTIYSPVSGKIKKLHIKEGDRVSKDSLLIEFDIAG